jgi:hypothetical protein
MPTADGERSAIGISPQRARSRRRTPAPPLPLTRAPARADPQQPRGAAGLAAGGVESQTRIYLKPHFLNPPPPPP